MKDVGNTKQLLQDFNKYCRYFQDWVGATWPREQHSEGHACCRACKQAMIVLKMVGGVEMVTLFDHVGMVVEGDTIAEAISKIMGGILKQSSSRDTTMGWGYSSRHSQSAWWSSQSA